MSREQKIREAAQRGQAALEDAVERLTPLVEQASELLTEASERLTPMARQAKVRGAAAAARALDNLQPRINHALDLVPPAVDAAQRRVQDDLIPKLISLLHDAARSEGMNGGIESLDLGKKRSAGATVAKVAAAGALVAGVAVAVRVFLKTRDNGWAAHEPSAAYTYAEEAAPVDDSEDELDYEDAPEADPDLSYDDSGEPGGREYGEGSYVGTEPPEGFVIKGSERSRKYHTPESGVYDRTKADVWFNSEEAAATAGFARAQR